MSQAARSSDQYSSGDDMSDDSSAAPRAGSSRYGQLKAPKGMTVGQVYDNVKGTGDVKTDKGKGKSKTRSRKRDKSSSSSSSGKAKKRRVEKSETRTGGAAAAATSDAMAQTMLNGMEALFERFASRIEGAIGDLSRNLEHGESSSPAQPLDREDVMRDVRDFIGEDRSTASRKRDAVEHASLSPPPTPKAKRSRKATSTAGVTVIDDDDDDDDNDEPYASSEDVSSMEDEHEDDDFDKIRAVGRGSHGAEPVVGVTSGDDVDEDDPDVYKGYTRSVQVHGKRREKMSLEEYETLRTRLDDVDEDAEKSAATDDFSDDDDDEDDEDEDDWNEQSSDADSDYSGDENVEQQALDAERLKHITFADIKNGTKRAPDENDIIVRSDHLSVLNDYLSLDDDEYVPGRRATVTKKWRALSPDMKRALKTYVNTCLCEDLCLGAQAAAKHEDGVSPSQTNGIDPFGSMGYNFLETVRNMPASLIREDNTKACLKSLCQAPNRKTFLKKFANLNRIVKRYNGALKKDHADGKRTDEELCSMHRFAHKSVIAMCATCREAADMPFDAFYNKYFFLIHGHDKMTKKEKREEAQRWYGALASLAKVSPLPLDTGKRDGPFDVKRDSWCAFSGYPFYSRDGPRKDTQIAYIVMSPQESALPAKQRRSHKKVNAGARVLVEVPRSGANDDPLFHPIAQMRDEFVKETEDAIKEAEEAGKKAPAAAVATNGFDSS